MGRYVAPVRPMSVEELIAELSTYPAGMSVYVGREADEALHKENLCITRRNAAHRGGPSVLHIRTTEGEGRCSRRDTCSDYEEA